MHGLSRRRCIPGRGFAFSRPCPSAHAFSSRKISTNPLVFCASCCAKLCRRLHNDPQLKPWALPFSCSTLRLEIEQLSGRPRAASAMLIARVMIAQLPLVSGVVGNGNAFAVRPIDETTKPHYRPVSCEKADREVLKRGNDELDIRIPASHFR